MLPQIKNNLDVINQANKPSHTYKMDFTSKRIIGDTDQLDAVVQSVQKIMETERFAHVIYPSYYGIELESLIGKDRNFVLATIEQRITECLTQDDRVLEISDFAVTNLDGESISVGFTVNTVFGKFHYSGVMLER